jgi:hypothetical protein
VKTKISAIAVAAFLILGVTTPVQAATEGGSCTKLNSKTQIGKNTFICIKNPYNKPTQLTWAWDGCVELLEEFSPAQKENLIVIKNAERDRTSYIAPIANSIQATLAWSSQIPYQKGDIVFAAGTYYTAVRSNLNKRLIASNNGNSRFWKVYQPTFSNPRIGQIPRPEAALNAASKIIDSISQASAKSNSASTKLVYSTLIANIEKNKSQLDQTKANLEAELTVLDDALETAVASWATVNLTLSSQCKP